MAMLAEIHQVNADFFRVLFRFETEVAIPVLKKHRFRFVRKIPT